MLYRRKLQGLRERQDYSEAAGQAAAMSQMAPGLRDPHMPGYFQQTRDAGLQDARNQTVLHYGIRREMDQDALAAQQMQEENVRRWAEMALRKDEMDWRRGMAEREFGLQKRQLRGQEQQQQYGRDMAEREFALGLDNLRESDRLGLQARQDYRTKMFMDMYSRGADPKALQSLWEATGGGGMAQEGSPAANYPGIAPARPASGAPIGAVAPVDPVDQYLATNKQTQTLGIPPAQTQAPAQQSAAQAPVIPATNTPHDRLMGKLDKLGPTGPTYAMKQDAERGSELDKRQREYNSLLQIQEENRRSKNPDMDKALGITRRLQEVRGVIDAITPVALQSSEEGRMLLAQDLLDQEKQRNKQRTPMPKPESMQLPPGLARVQARENARGIAGLRTAIQQPAPEFQDEEPRQRGGIDWSTLPAIQRQAEQKPVQFSEGYTTGLVRREFGLNLEKQDFFGAGTVPDKDAEQAIHDTAQVIYQQNPGIDPRQAVGMAIEELGYGQKEQEQEKARPYAERKDAVDVSAIDPANPDTVRAYQRGIAPKGTGQKQAEGAVSDSDMKKLRGMYGDLSHLRKEDVEALKWAHRNKKDPRAQKIFATLNMRPFNPFGF